MNRQRIFIAIEGLDGVGKSTISKKLSNAISERGNPTISIKSPIGGYQLALPYISSECAVDSQYLFHLSGIRHTSDFVRGMLKEFNVVCDRYYYSTIAYHIAKNTSVSIDVDSLNLLAPDFGFYIRADEKIRQMRLSKRKEKKPGDEELKKPGNIIDRIEKEFLDQNLIIIDNTMRSLNDVITEMLNIIEDNDQ